MAVIPMCGRFILTTSSRQLADRFALAEEPSVAPRYNIAPSQDVLAVRADAGGARRAEPLRWGLIPAWAEDPAIGARAINARSETAATRPAFRDALRRRRCLVPADGFYEWKGRGPERHPLLLRARTRETFAIAGLWAEWVSPLGEAIESCALLTTGPNALLRSIHDRMPVILAPDDWERWLDPRPAEPADLAPLLRPAPDDWLDATRVSDRVNRVGVDDPGCIEPAPAPLALFPELA